MGKGVVYTIQGNLLESDCNVIIHQANCFATMGAGIAKQIKTLYPSVYYADRNFQIPVGSESRLGRTSHSYVEGPHGRLLVINLYGQYNYGHGKQTDYEAFTQGLHSIMRRMDKLGRGYKIGLPFGVGCGLAGGHWPTVLAIIEEAAEQYQRDIYLYKL